MSELFCTLGFSSNATEEERVEQSNERIKAAKKLAKCIDETKQISLEKILDKLIAHFEYEKITPMHERDSLQNCELEEFVKKALQASIREQQIAELKTKMLFLMYKEINYCFDTFSSCVEKNFPNHTKKTIEKAIAQAYYALDVTRSGRSVVEFFDIHPDKIYEISKIDDFKGFVYFEDFVRENKVSTKNLKRMIEILKNKEALSLETAYEKAKEEAQRNKKINHGNVTEIRKLKNDYKKMIEYWQHAVKEREKAECRYENLKKENLRTVKQKDVLIEKFNNFATQIIKSDKFEFSEIFHNELKKIESELRNVGISISVLENLNRQVEPKTTNTEEKCRKDFAETT